jgi:tetratricopeptide (TPR) repeat protein
MILERLKNWVKGLFDASQSPLKSVDPPQPPLKRGENEVLVKSLEMIAAGESRAVIYEYWKANLEDLKDENLLIILEQYAQAKLSSLTGKSVYWFANNLVDFNIYINEFPLGSIAINKELAIKSCELGLTVLTFRDYPNNWARIKNSLGIAYSDRIRGERADNLETVIACYQEAFKVYTFAAFPEYWATTQGNLGTAYSDRIRGERADNLESAIACYQEALKVSTFTAFPYNWAMTQMNLGSAYQERIRGERADNLEAAIACYQEALKVYTFTAFPYNWAMTQMNLGSAYQERIRGERADNLEAAITCYQEALKVRTFDAFPQDWAMTQMNLGNAYKNRIRGERADNLESAIACYQEALKLYTFDSFPQQWAVTQGNLAGALGARASLTNNPQDLDQAIELYGQALTVSAPGSYYFIEDQYNLGNALARRYENSKNSDDLQQSLAAYQIALNYLSPEHYNRQEYWQAIPATQAILGSRLVRDGNWQEGLQLLINSLNQLKTGDNSLVYANALYQTGYAYELLSDQENARLYYRDALRLYEHLQDLPGIAKSRESLGNVFVSQGHLEKGMSELAQAREIYQQLGKTEAAEKVHNTYQSVQQALEQVKNEVLA